MRREMRVVAIGAKAGRRQNTAHLLLVGESPISAEGWSSAKGKPLATIRIFDPENVGRLLYEERFPECTVRETIAGTEIAIKIKWSWPCYREDLRLTLPETEAAERSYCGGIVSRLTELSMIFGQQCIGDSLEVDLVLAEQPAAKEAVLPFVKKAIEDMRPTPESGIASVTLESGGSSVTLHSDGRTETKREEE